MNRASRHLVIVAAGTGGHIIPGLAVAREMLSRGHSVSWMGTPAGMENRLVPQEGIELDQIGFSGLRGKGALGFVTGGFRLLKAFWECARVLRTRRASAVLGMGGYLCFPAGVMASLFSKPLVIVNADAALLMSNRALAPIADRICFGLESVAAKSKRSVVTGNPVRLEIEALAPPEERFADRVGPLRVLVVGGSMGAQALNVLVPQALRLIDPGARPLVIHQSGEKNLAALQATYAELGLSVEVRPFISDMAHELAACDLMICRAGAITVSELCAAGVASCLVPLVVSTTSHQRDNALWLESLGAAIHAPQNELTAQGLAALLASLSRGKLLEMAKRARAAARLGAASKVADEIEALLV